MATEEQDITTVRYILQRLKIDDFEDAALSEISSAYMKAKSSVASALDKAVARELAKVGTDKVPNPAAVARLKELQVELNDKVDDISSKITPYVADAAAQAGAYSYKDTADIISWGGRVKDFNKVTMTARQLKALMIKEPYGGKTLDEWLFSAFKGEHQAIYDELVTDIRAGRLAGTGYKGIMSNLKNRYGNLLGSKEVERNLETVTKSYIQAANAKSHADLYEANKDVIKGVEWSAILENGNSSTGRGTCPRCAALDGQKYKSKEDAPNCPLHPRCRCMLIPVTKSWEELGIDGTGIDEIRAEVDKKYGPAMKKWAERDLGTRRKLEDGLIDGNYSDLWKDKPVEWQNNAIGPKRADLVRAGLVEFENIVDKEGNLIPIKDLKLGKKVKKKVTPPKPKAKPKVKANPYPLPRTSTGLVKDNPATPFGSEFTNKYSKAFAASAPKELQADYLDYFMSVDSDVVTKSKGKGKVSSHYQPANKTINMAVSKAKETREGMTFLHEFGHRTDHKWGNMMHKKWGSSAVEFPMSRNNKFVSTTSVYRNALLADRAHIGDMSDTSLAKLGGTVIENQPRKVALTKAMLEKETEFDSRYHKLSNSADRAKILKAAGVEPKYQYLADNIDELVAGYKLHRKSDFYDKYASNAEYRMRRAIVLAQETGAESFILRDYIDAGTEFFTDKNSPRSMLYLADFLESTTLTEFGQGHGIGYITKSGGWGQQLEAFGNVFALNGSPFYKRFFKDYAPNQSGAFDGFIAAVKEFEDD